ncbi:hypothetical protein U9M48_008492 [Paspalum notatum var. saurae]|uniref:Uncharacterized protein n=1 Tax=Paspalum notatum var. saurae TaxID=547442 RepID=A0AAQ3SP89_PASNO
MSTHRPILILESQLVPRSQDEAKALRSLNQKTYALTKCFDEDLLVDTGMREEFNEVFQAIGEATLQKSQGRNHPPYQRIPYDAPHRYPKGWV